MTEGEMLERAKIALRAVVFDSFHHTRIVVRSGQPDKILPSTSRKFAASILAEIEAAQGNMVAAEIAKGVADRTKT